MSWGHWSTYWKHRTAASFNMWWYICDITYEMYMKTLYKQCCIIAHGPWHCIVLVSRYPHVLHVHVPAYTHFACCVQGQHCVCDLCSLDVHPNQQTRNWDLHRPDMSLATALLYDKVPWHLYTAHHIHSSWSDHSVAVLVPTMQAQLSSSVTSSMAPERGRDLHGVAGRWKNMKWTKNTRIIPWSSLQWSQCGHHQLETPYGQKASWGMEY